MNSLWKNDDFCRDAFAAELAGGMREAVVSEMARARRGVRVARYGRMAGACAMLVALLVAISGRKTELQTVVVAPKTFKVVDTLRVRSAPFAGIVRSGALSAGMMVTSDEAQLAIVRTEGPRLYELISDEQMLALLRGRSVALMKVNGVAEAVIWDGR
jgi:hypothetical protein